MNTLRWTAALLCVAQTFAISGTVIAASVDVRCIVFILPVLCLIGLFVGILGCGLRSISLPLFGLTPCVMSLHVVYLIQHGNLQPPAAAQPLTALLLNYELLVTPIGVFAFVRVLSSPGRQHSKRAEWRFGLRAVFGATLVVAVLLGVVRSCLDAGFETPVWMSLAMAMGALEAVILGSVALHRRRRISPRTRPCPPWILGACLVGYAVAPYLSAVLVREYPSPISPWESICQTAGWHFPTLLAAVPIFAIVWFRSRRQRAPRAG